MRLGIKRFKRRAHFLHIGKSGGTAVNAALEPVRSSGRYEIVLDGHDVNLRQIPAGDRFCFVVRDPLERFVSAFNDRQRWSHPRYHQPWTLEEERAYGWFTTADSLGRGLSSADDGLRAAAFEAMATIYHVRHSYWHWFCDPGYFQSRLDDLLYVMWLPNLPASFARLCRLLEVRAELPVDDVGAHRDPGHMPRHLSAVASENLRLWFRRDFEFIDMCSRLRQADPVLGSAQLERGSGLVAHEHDLARVVG